MIYHHAPPLEPCPTKQNDERLGEVLGWAANVNPELGTELWDLGTLYTDSGSYCRGSENLILRTE